MGDLGTDTALEGTGGHYRAHLSRDWEIWGPNGGYLAVIALRAAGAAAADRGLVRPASFACQFLSVADFHDVEVAVETLRASKRSAAFRMQMLQDGRLILTALAWVVDASLGGLEHDAAPMPSVPPPEAIPTYDQRRDPDAPHHIFWDNIETREDTWSPTRTPDEPVWRAWCRFRPAATFDDPFLDAGRSLLLLDTMTWPAAVKAHKEKDPFPYVAPSLDVSAQFHRLAPAEPWLLCEARAPLAADGLIGCASRVWARDGRLLASGSSQLFCRPVPS